eukprot:scaffold37348_cov42-Prasinocladus_malaysianus.AAC.1
MEGLAKQSSLQWKTLICTTVICKRSVELFPTFISRKQAADDGYSHIIGSAFKGHATCSVSSHHESVGMALAVANVTAKRSNLPNLTASHSSLALTAS